jgi:hypothetical protein
MVNPSQRPYLQNVTCAHNKTRGIWQTGGAVPEIYNSIVYHNGGEAIFGFSADNAAYYSCIEDCNSVNNNISTDPQFAYFDPNNIRITTDSPCHDSGLTLQENYTQVDMDSRTRVLGTTVDRGAYEIECEDASNSFDLNADGLVNFHEYAKFSAAWLGHDPNDPVFDPNSASYNPNVYDPNHVDYISPDQQEGWYEWKQQYNYDTAGSGQYAIDLADLTIFLEEAPWLWCACWLDLEEMQAQQMMSGGAESSMLVPSGVEEMVFAQAEAITETPVIEEKSVQEQILDLASAIVFLEQLWLEDPYIQQEIDAKDWQEFMDAVYQNLIDLKTETVQLEE